MKNVKIMVNLKEIFIELRVGRWVGGEEKG